MSAVDVNILALPPAILSLALGGRVAGEVAPPNLLARPPALVSTGIAGKSSAPVATPNIFPLPAGLLSVSTAGRSATTCPLPNTFKTPTSSNSVPGVSGFVPSDGTSVQPLTPITLTVTDLGNPLVGIILIAVMGAAQEVVYDGEAFAAEYANSTITPIPAGYSFTVRRTDGWPRGGVTFKTRAFDSVGNTNIWAP